MLSAKSILSFLYIDIWRASSIPRSLFKEGFNLLNSAIFSLEDPFLILKVLIPIPYLDNLASYAVQDLASFWAL